MTNSSGDNMAMDYERWTLPFDLVSDIMAISPASTISMLMKTCRMLYMEGPKHLLRDEVELNRPIDILKFASFMLTDDRSRFAYLRKLVWNIPFLSNVCYQARLIDLLTHPSLALETLILHHPNAFPGQAGSRAAFCALKTVKRLVVFDAQAASARTIADIPSPLESVSISFSAAGLSRPSDISSTLKPFSSTLHTLLINSESYSSLFLNVRPHDFPLSHVQTFSIVWDDSVPELLANPTFTQAFPAIKHLQLIRPGNPAIIEPITPVSREPPTIARSHVRVNDETQTWSEGTAGLASRLSLPALDECSGTLFSVYTLGLERTLATLRFWRPIQACDFITLGVVLEKTCPRHLRLTTDINDVPSLFSALSALETPAPARIDLYISGAWSYATSNWTSKNALNWACSTLEWLFRGSPPSGLAELTLLFDIPERLLPSGKWPLGNVEEACVRWASTASPPLSLAWRFSVDKDEWRWSDVGQTERDDDNGDGDDDDYGCYEDVFHDDQWGDMDSGEEYSLPDEAYDDEYDLDQLSWGWDGEY